MGCARRASRVSVNPSTRRSPTAWALASRSAARLSKPMVGGCGRPGASRGVLSFSLRSPLTEPPSVIDVAYWPIATYCAAARSRSLLESAVRGQAFLHSAAPGDLHSPGLEPGPFLRTQHALRCFVEHHPHHLISAARYPATPIDLAGLIPGACQPKHCPDRLGLAESGWHIDGSAIGQRHHRADTGGRH